MKEFFKELFEYNHLVNQEFIRCFAGKEAGIPEKSVRLLNHLINAQQIWNCRIEGKKNSTGVWDIHPLTMLEAMNQANLDESLRILKSIDLDAMIAYTNIAGNAYQSSVQNILFHVLNHSSYHRGQVASGLVEAGIEAPVSDYIAFKR